MARDIFSDTMALAGVNGALAALNNIQVTVYTVNADGSRGPQATIYQARTGAAQGPLPVTGATGTNPFVTSASGAVGFWGDAAEYEIVLHDLTVPARIADRSIYWAAVPAADAGIPARLIEKALGNSWLLDDSINARVIATGAVGTAEVADDAITAAKIAPDAVGTTEIATDAVTSAEIAANAVGSSELAAVSVTLAKIAAGVGGKILAAISLDGFSVTANTSALLSTDVVVAHNNKAILAVLFTGGYNDSDFNGPFYTFQIRLDGVLQGAIGGGVVPNPRNAFTHIGVQNFGVLNGNHNWTVRAEQGNTPSTMRNGGRSLLLLWEVY